MGKKIIDLVMRRDASRGRKSEAGGGEENQRQGGGEIIKGYGTIYTPVNNKASSSLFRSTASYQTIDV